MPQAVSDVPSNANEQIAHAAKVIGRSRLARLVFGAIHTGKRRVKSVPYLSKRTRLTPKQVLTQGKRLVDSHLIDFTREGGGTAYIKNDFLHRYKRKVLSLAGNPKRESRYPTKRNPANRHSHDSMVRPRSRSSGPRRMRRRKAAVVKILFIAANPLQSVAVHPKTKRP